MQKVQEATQLALKFGVIERCQLAEQLEQKAEQLRDFKQAPIPFIGEVRFGLRPKMKEALIVFYNEHCGPQEHSEAEKLSCGALWILESAIPHLEMLHLDSWFSCDYRKAEDLEGSA